MAVLKTRTEFRKEKSPEHKLRAFVIGASPAATIEHTRELLIRFKADPATDLFIGVDGGVQAWFAAGFKPHMAVGDWDSLSGPKARKLLASIHHLTLPVDKDRSDLYYAACSVANAGATHLICLGVTGGRPDHHLGTLSDLASLAQGKGGLFREISAYSPEASYHFLSPKMPVWRESFASPRTVSVFALNGPAKGVTMKGLKYPMKNGILDPSSHGLSNRTWSRACEVSVKEGSLLVLIPSEDFSLSA
jgi:thiamine pyrophosphokinase